MCVADSFVDIFSGLISYLSRLSAIGIYKPADIRPILESYHGKDIPIEYAKTEAAAKQKHIEEHLKKGMANSTFTLSTLFGGSSSPVRRRSNHTNFHCSRFIPSFTDKVTYPINLPGAKAPGGSDAVQGGASLHPS